MTLRCSSCGSFNLRTAHFRKTDILKLFLLQYPMRCRSCRTRAHAFLFRIIGMPRHGEPIRH
jgi:hypothetical protein